MMLSAFATLKPLFAAHEQSELEIAIQYLYDAKITSFATPSTFRSNDHLSRQEAAKLLTLFMTNTLKATGISSSCSFVDLTNADSTLIPFILQSCDLGLFR